MVKSKKLSKKNHYTLLLIFVFLVLVLLTLSTKYIGSTDTSSFTSVAKYFAGEYSAKIRSSHSLLFGIINSPYVALLKSFISFKIINLFVFGLLFLSVFHISGKNKKAFFLIFFSPIVWYMAPWVNSIQVSSLLFLWAYYFMTIYDREKKLKTLCYSGLFFGLSAAFWHAIFFFGVFFVIFFMYNKELKFFFIYLVSILIGLLPVFILDFFLYSSPFYSLLKNNFGTISNLFAAGVYSVHGLGGQSFLGYLAIFLLIPFYFFFVYHPKNFKKDLKTNLFLTTSLLIITKNPQIRYLFLIVPIMILSLSNTLSAKQFKRLIIYSIILSVLVSVPYVIQIKYSTDCEEFGSLIQHFPHCTFSQDWPEDPIAKDLIEISASYPNQSFLVGNRPDDYQILANVYWGKDVKEFVSMQDYILYSQNTSTLVEREIRFSPKNIQDRREFWLKGGIGKPLNDKTNYSDINYALSLNNDLNIEGFKLIKSYRVLNLFEKK